MNIFINFFLVIIILLTKLACFRKICTLYIWWSGAFLCSNSNTCIVFQPFRIILLLNTSEVSFFTKALCIFAILSTIALNFPRSTDIFFSKYLWKIGNALLIFIFIFFLLVTWQFNTFCITVLFTVIVTIVLALVFIVFTVLFLTFI